MSIMKLVCDFVIILNLGICLGAPTTAQSNWETDPEFTNGYFEGDIILDNKRNGVNNINRFWPGGKIYYKFDSIFDEDHRAAIRAAMDTIETPTCVRFEEMPPSSEQQHYVKITGDQAGCNAQVGNLRREQYLNLQVYPLNTGCFVAGKIIHELLHVVGFFHMHSASNRDAYIQIVSENIQTSAIGYFQKLNLNDFGVEYDYGSIMHYPADAFSTNGLPTIVALQELPAGSRMGQRVAMTASDILKVNLMYRCFEEITTTTTTTTESISTTPLEEETSSTRDANVTV